MRVSYARSGDILIVWKLDRLARSMKQLIEIVEKLRLRGIGFRSLMEAIDTTTAQGVLVFHMFSALAEFERALIREVRWVRFSPFGRRATIMLHYFPSKSPNASQLVPLNKASRISRIGW